MAPFQQSGREVAVREPTPFDQLLGTEMVACGAGESTARLQLTPQHCNRRGVAHGGVVSALLDTALGAAVVSTLTPQEWCGTLQLSVQFRDPARGAVLQARGRVVRRGRTVVFAEGEALDGTGNVVASAHGIWTVWPAHPDGVPAR